MVDNNETVAGIVSKVRSGDYGCAKCGDLCDCPNADKIIASIADRIEAAHEREVDAILKDRDEMYKSEQETIAKTNAWFGEYQTLKREVAELREFSNDMRTWFRLYYSCGSNPKSKWWRSCASCRRKRCPIHKWRKALEGASNA